MTKARIFALSTIVVALLVAGCGGGGGNGGGNVPSDAVALVGDQKISRTEFDRLWKQAQRNIKRQGQELPKVGTARYTQLRNQILDYLVKLSEREQKAGDLGVQVTTKEIDQRLAQIKKQIFQGNEKRYQQTLKQQGITEADVRSEIIKPQLLAEEISKKVTADIKVSDDDVKAYYDKNKQQFSSPETRVVRHILVAVCTAGQPKSPNCKPDAQAKTLANQLYKRVKGGANFAKLASQYSNDPGSKKTGGRLTISRGQTLPTFDQTAFLLPNNAISRPIKTSFGYHIIQALGPIKPPSVSPLSQVKESIKQQLLQQKRTTAINTFYKKLETDFDVKYQTGFSAPPKPTTTGATATTG